MYRNPSERKHHSNEKKATRKRNKKQEERNKERQHAAQVIPTVCSVREQDELSQLIFPLFLLLGTCAQSQFIVQLINNTIMIFFHNESFLRISQDKWTLLVYRDLDPEKQTLGRNSKVLSHIADTFEQLTSRMARFQAKITTHYSLLTQSSQFKSTKCT